MLAFPAQYRTPAIVAAVVILAIALWMIVSQLFGGGEGGADPAEARTVVLFQDLTTGERFEADPFAVPPIQSPAGNEAVRVHLFQCPGGDVFVGYFEKYTDYAKGRVEQVVQERKMPPYMAEAVARLPQGQGRLISVDGKTWIPLSDPKAQKAIDEKLVCPGGGVARAVTDDPS